jgi:type II secretory pathway pseudopilin PulG
MGRVWAFTLVEILVVVAIVTVLITLAIPSYRAVRLRSMAASGTSNLRELHGLFTAYCSDHDGEMPLGGGKNTKEEGRNDLSWINRLVPYAGKPELAEVNLNSWWEKPPPHPVFKDPGIDLPGEWMRARSSTEDAIWGFGYNVQPFLPDNGAFLANWYPEPSINFRLPAVSKPSSRILFASAYDWFINGAEENRAYHRYGKDKALAGYFDGHAAMVSREEYNKGWRAP